MSLLILGLAGGMFDDDLYQVEGDIRRKLMNELEWPLKEEERCKINSTAWFPPTVLLKIAIEREVNRLAISAARDGLKNEFNER